ncbi:transcriptional regulator, TetR family [Sporobacter termitidis DSM 10068]|uniref:Transcriptional regulator, TetR family n=1 Tax=Sporobacter termitidis DSM 10068 TaxID=1123282 RepID=A0A1M5TWR7_9FIRM|nr:TetR/AcrR family transcriptional regulator [Sporobacter termitidis]SHH55050.1 transcriptional regulator, TetR family [Sporobacter termitidis DSM 10068]
MSDKETKKAEIVKAAKELFTNFGYKAVSMDSIAERAGVAKGTLYLYFKDKEALFYYLLEEFIGKFDVLLRQIMSKDLPLVDEIVEVIYTMLTYRKKQKFLFKVMTEARDMKIAIAKNGVKMIDDQIAAYLKSRLDSIVTDKLNLEIIAFVIIRSYGALAFEWEEFHEPLDERKISQSIGVIFGGLLTAAENKERALNEN